MGAPTALGMLFSVAAVVLAFADATGTADADDTEPGWATSLLQVAAAVREGPDLGGRGRVGVLDPVHYDQGSYYGLASIKHAEEGNLFDTIITKNGTCATVVPNVTGTMMSYNFLKRWSSVDGKQHLSTYTFGECPEVLPGRRARLDLRLDSVLDGVDESGWNPSLMPLPAHLQQAFPTGRWLATIRSGSSQCPFGSEKVHPLTASIFATAFKESLPMSGASATDVDSYAQAWAMQDTSIVRTWVAVLDGGFKVLTRSKLDVRHGTIFSDSGAVSDARMFQLRDGQILVGFTPYMFQYGPYAKHNDSWWFHEVVGLLHTEAAGTAEAPEVRAWVDRWEFRDLVECPERGLHAPGARKNLGFFEDDDGVHAVDWIFPTKIGKVDVDAVVPDPSVDVEVPSLPWEDQHVRKACFGYEPEPAPLMSDPWAGIIVQDHDGLRKGGPHNTAPLLWVAERGAYLGIGHMHRGFGGFQMGQGPFFAKYGHHYTHQFYLLAGEAPHGLIAVGREVCFGSDARPDDCESVQFASSLNRDGNNLMVAYGVFDCESFVTVLDLGKVLAGLRPVS